MNKKLLGLVITAVIITGCTGTGGGGSKGGYTSIPDLGGVFEYAPSLEQEDIVLSSSTPSLVIDEIRTNASSNATRRASSSATFAESYLGESLHIPLRSDETDVRITSKPDKATVSLRKSGNDAVFMSIYAGRYVLTAKGATERNVVITNKSKYKITESDLTSVINDNYETKNLTQMKDSLRLYRMLFPTSFIVKTNAVKLIELAYENRDIATVKSEYQTLVRNGELTSADRTKLVPILAESGINDLDLDDSFLTYTSTATELNAQMGSYIVSKATQTSAEIKFLESLLVDVPNKIYSDVIGNWYMKNGNKAVADRYLTGDKRGISGDSTSAVTPVLEASIKDIQEQNYTSFKKLYDEGERNYRNQMYGDALTTLKAANDINRNYTETAKLLFYIAESARHTGDYNLAMSNYRAALNVETSNDRKPEIYYNMGVTAHLSGDVASCRNYMNYVRQQYPSSSWSTKSALYLSELN